MTLLLRSSSTGAWWQRSRRSASPRVKRAPGLAPARSVQEVLDLGGVTGHDLDAIAYPWNPRGMGLTDEAVVGEIRSWLVPAVGRSPAPVEFVEHHVAHAWSAVPFAPGDLAGRRVVALVLDGSGESTSGAALRLDDGEFAFLWTLSQAGSVGIYYEAITHYVGFTWGEEGKTMGLAAYGRPGRVRLPAIIDDRSAGPPVASDTGVAIGAAAAVSARTDRLHPGTDPGLGRSFPTDVVTHALRQEGWHVGATGPDKVADLLLDGKVGAWFGGGSEVGPRALGRRSLIARPDSVVVRDRVNQLKRRESWRPLAPSVSRSQFDRNFAGATPNAFMVVAARSEPSVAVELEGTVHVDGTARPQVVAAGSAFGSVLAAMAASTGVEAVLNTSFNLAGDALAYSPADAAHAARHMQLDFLAGDGWVAELTA
jgi:predicted NodU family carbamoyl transferase